MSWRPVCIDIKVNMSKRHMLNISKSEIWISITVKLLCSRMSTCKHNVISSKRIWSSDLRPLCLIASWYSLMQQARFFICFVNCVTFCVVALSKLAWPLLKTHDWSLTFLRPTRGCVKRYWEDSCTSAHSWDFPLKFRLQSSFYRHELTLIQDYLIKQLL